MSEPIKAHQRDVNDKKFKKYRVLLTGDEGFIARKLKNKLRQQGHDVIGYDIVRGQDLLDIGTLEHWIKQVDVVMHLAAQADLTQMQKLEDGKKGADVNVVGTHNVAYLCAKHKKWLIYGSTVCVYGNVEEHPEREDHTLPNPSELYSCSKYAGELLVKGYGLNFGMPWTSLRFATIYGEGMRPALGLHIFFTQAIKGKPITVHGDGKQVRTLTFIDDLVDGIAATLEHEKEANGQIINLTATVGVSALKMAEDVKRITGTSAPIEHVDQRPNQTWHEDFDVSKAKKILGWEAATPWEKGLEATYEWMKTQDIEGGSYVPPAAPEPVQESKEEVNDTDEDSADEGTDNATDTPTDTSTDSNLDDTNATDESDGVDNDETKQ